MRDPGVDEALIDALVTAADEHRPCAGRPAFDRIVPQGFADRREQHHRRRCAARRQGRVETRRQRLGHHDHAGTAAERPVVDATVVAVGEVARIPKHDLDLLRFEGTSRHAAREKGREQFGKEREDVEAHRGAHVRLSSRAASRP